MSMNSQQQPPVVGLKASELNSWGGIFCPSPQAHMAVKNNHPRVQVQVSDKGEGQCIYCGTIYRLKAGEHFSGH